MISVSQKDIKASLPQQPVSSACLALRGNAVTLVHLLITYCLAPVLFKLRGAGAEPRAVAHTVFPGKSCYELTCIPIETKQTQHLTNLSQTGQWLNWL